MKTHRKTRVALAVAGAAALVAAGSAAYAHSPWVVAAGGVTTGTVAYTTTATGTSENPAVAFTAGAAHMTCESASSSGDVFLGTTPVDPIPPAPPVGYYSNIQGITFSSCLAEGILPMEVTVAATSTDPWNVKITGDKIVPVPPDTRANRSPIQIYDIHAHIQDIGTAGGTCGMDVDGTVNGIVDSDVQELEVLTADSGLVVSNVTGGCFGLTIDGDSATFAGVFDVANAVGPITFDH